MAVSASFIKKLKCNASVFSWAELIEKTQDVNYTNYIGRSVIFYLVINKEKHLIKEAIKNGADINIKDHSDSTPMLCFVDSERLWDFNSDFIKFLIEHGANPLLSKRNDLAFYNHVDESNYTWLLTYHFQKKLITRIPEMYVELKYIKRRMIDNKITDYIVNLLNPKIEKEFAYLETGKDLGLLN